MREQASLEGKSPSPRASSLDFYSTVLCDARWFGFHGIGRFAREVLARLPGHAEIATGPKPVSPFDPIWLSYQIGARRPSVFFSPGFNSPAMCRCPFVFTIHDLIHLRVPDVATVEKRLYYRFVIQRAAQRAYRVLTVSEFSRQEILRWSELAPERVVNVGNGVSEDFSPNGPRYRPGFEYVFCIGNTRKHKNLKRLFRAFRALDREGLQLVLTGTASPEMLACIAAADLTRRVSFLGYVQEHLLPAVYRGAALVAIPSLVEGFGLPAIEAMACGVPVVASLTSALPEVVGDAGVYINPFDVDDLRRGMQLVLDDLDLRSALRGRGLQRARQFSWNRVAARISAVLADAANGAPR